MAELVLLDKRQRAAKTYDSTEFAVPVGTRKLIFNADMDLADRIDVTLTYAWAIEASFDNGASWIDLFHGGFSGRLDGEGNAADPPNQEYQAPVMPTNIRARFTNSRPVSVGLRVTTE